MPVTLPCSPTDDLDGLHVTFDLAVNLKGSAADDFEPLTDNLEVVTDDGQEACSWTLRCCPALSRRFRLHSTQWPKSITSVKSQGANNVRRAWLSTTNQDHQHRAGKDKATF